MLHPRLVGQTLTVDAPTQEDWGWMLLIRQGADVFTLALGIMDEAIGKVPAQWRLGISFEKSGIRSWFRAAPTSQLDGLFDTLRQIVTAEPRFSVSEEE